MLNDQLNPTYWLLAGIIAWYATGLVALYRLPKKFGFDMFKNMGVSAVLNLVFLFFFMWPIIYIGVEDEIKREFSTKVLH